MIAVIGAGISGLTSALTLQKLGHKIIIIDKGVSAGGRLATRYATDSKGTKRYIDTAAHYIDFTADSPRFNELMWESFPELKGSPRMSGSPGINSIAKALASQLQSVEVLTNHKATSVCYDERSKKIQIAAKEKDQSRNFAVDAVLCTAPVPQSIDLIPTFSNLVESLKTAPTYYKSLLLLLWPKKPVTLESFKKSKNVYRIVLQSHIKENTEPIPVAVHATYEWSDEAYKLGDEEIKTLLMEEVGISEDQYDRVQVKRWVCLWESMIVTIKLIVIGSSTTEDNRSIREWIRL